MRRLLVLAVALLISPALLRAQGKPAFSVDDLFKLERIGDPQISPDGNWVVYTVGSVDMKKNAVPTNLWLASTDGKTKKQLTSTLKKDRHPRWSPDGRQILFESSRSGSMQLWLIDLAGGEPRRITDVATGAWNGAWSADGQQIAFVSAVFPENSDKPFKESNELNQKKLDEDEKNPVKARVFTKLFFRHWDEYVGGTRQHLFVMKTPTDATSLPEPRDVTPGDRDGYPTSMTFSVGDDFTFSPDGKFLLYTAPTPADKGEAWDTNHDIYRQSLADPKAQPENLTKNNLAADGYPQFSADGKMLAYRAQSRPGFEADRWQIIVVPTAPDGSFKAKPRSVTDKIDLSVDQIGWIDVRRLFFTAEKDARQLVWQVPLTNDPMVQEFDLLQPGQTTLAGTLSSISIARKNGNVAFLRSSLLAPPEVWAVRRGNGGDHEAVAIKSANQALMEGIGLPTFESVTVKGAGGTPMQMWIGKPPGFDASKKWPLVYLVHGGPQGAWTDGWSWRWNPALWAAQGYVVALPNPRGSTGFGQKYVDDISLDWGGKVYEDLLKGLDYLEGLPFIDKERLAAAGASYGGYMMNWFEGNTTRFKTLINHCGVYNLESMYATTEEIWFAEWELGGKPWEEKAESYKKFSPHRLAKNFKTPMLIIHGDLDFRVPVTQGIEAFTTLQRLGIESKMINFPDEGHWVLKPANSKYWHEQVFAWLKKFAPPGGK